MLGLFWTPCMPKQEQEYKKLLVVGRGKLNMEPCIPAVNVGKTYMHCSTGIDCACKMNACCLQRQASSSKPFHMGPWNIYTHVHSLESTKKIRSDEKNKWWTSWETMVSFLLRINQMQDIRCQWEPLKIFHGVSQRNASKYRARKRGYFCELLKESTCTRNRSGPWSSHSVNVVYGHTCTVPLHISGS